MNSSPVPLKTRLAKGPINVKYVAAQTSSGWCGVEVRRGVEPPQLSSSSLDNGLILEVRDEAHFWFNGYVNKQNCRILSEANPQVYVETPLHPEKLTVWCALWAGGILLQKR
ncbi:hypothetical protein TNCV_276941 [Trichonephila clavipes]|uniref:Uncharacterized protein n=1 Tax=Trichonephila clavipes TaxID=2585209 RepID=A0A8X6V6Y2_TRICX|nr:hypothetical protein TNCV_276941 [Trichonephila clavipes]